MLNLIIGLFILCSSFGITLSKITTEYGFRKLTPRECLRFQGFPDTFNIPTDIANSAVYKQAGNSVSVPVIQRGFRKTVANQLVTERELRASKASMVMGMRLMKTGQLTENSVIFDDFLGIPGFCVNLSLIYRDKAPIDFDVMDWYNTRPVFLQERISELMFDVTFSNKNAIEQFLASKSGHKMVRCISSDIVEGDSKKLIGYFFNIEYNRL